jgi:GT2 family glycosyltransferase
MGEEMVSIVIPVLNGPEITRDCLTALKRNTTVPHEVIVVDNGSQAKTRELLQTSKHIDKLIRNEENTGFVNAVNRGWDESTGDFLMTINNDTIPGPGWLEPLIAMASHPTVGLTGKFGGFLRPDYTNFYMEPEIPRECDYIEGSCLIMRREVYAKFGGFKPIMSPAYCEDTDLAVRSHRHGYRVLCEPRIDFQHLAGQTSKTIPGIQAIIARNQQYLRCIHGPCETVLATHFPVTVIYYGSGRMTEYYVPHDKDWYALHKHIEGTPIPLRPVYWECVMSGQDSYDINECPTDWVLVLKDGETMPPQFIMALPQMTLPQPDGKIRDGWTVSTPDGVEPRLFRRSKCQWDPEAQRITNSESGVCGVYSGPGFILVKKVSVT